MYSLLFVVPAPLSTDTRDIAEWNEHIGELRPVFRIVEGSIELGAGLWVVPLENGLAVVAHAIRDLEAHSMTWKGLVLESEKVSILQ
jgi:hypothetical protein